MKTLVTSLLLTASFTLTNFSATYAASVPARKPAQVASYQSGIYTTVAGKLNIALDKETGGTIDVRLTNEAGQVVFDQRVGKNQTTVRLRLDLNNLPDGAYQVVISNGKNVTTHAVTISTRPAVNTPRLVALN